MTIDIRAFIPGPHFNLTSQMRLRRANPSLAAHYQREAAKLTEATPKAPAMQLPTGQGWLARSLAAQKRRAAWQEAVQRDRVRALGMRLDDLRREIGAKDSEPSIEDQHRIAELETQYEAATAELIASQAPQADPKALAAENAELKARIAELEAATTKTRNR